MARPAPRDLLERLHRLYADLARRFPGDRQPPAVPHIVISRRGGRGRRSLCHLPAEGVTASPLPLALRLPARLLAADPADVAHAMLHGMVHLANHHAGVADAPGRYHNAAFHDLARAVGLEVPRRSKQRGWSLTHPTPELLEELAGLDFLRRPPEPPELPREHRRASASTLRPWRCRCPQRVYSHHDIELVCPRCGTSLVPAA